MVEKGKKGRDNMEFCMGDARILGCEQGRVWGGLGLDIDNPSLAPAVECCLGGLERWGKGGECKTVFELKRWIQ